jgi:threonine/homoserine/homoserine lactone efflux protein
MNSHLWLAFVAASAVMGLAPGPVVTSIVGYALSSGRATALAAVAGVAIGNTIAMSLSLGGVGALLSASALAFAILKWAGAAYLIGLGVVTILRSRHSAGETTARTVIAPRTAFVSNVALGTFHPKTIVFFVAFVPQFIDSRADYRIQALILVATFVLVVAVTDTTYALAASGAARLLRKPSAALWMKRAGGSVLIAAGAATAVSRT